MIRAIVKSIVLVPLLFASVQAQAKLWTVTLSSGADISGCVLHNVRNDTLRVLINGRFRAIPVDSIIALSHKEPRHVGSGVAIGMLAGAAIGAVIGYLSYEKPMPDPDDDGFGPWDFGPGGDAIGGGLIGILPGGLLGGLIGAIPREEVHEWIRWPTPSKVQVLEALIEKE